MQKARRHPQAPTACKRMVSGSFHSLSQGSFHLSFTVLVRYRSLSSIQPQQMVLLYSDRVSPAPPYSNNFYIIFTYGTITLYGLIFQKILLMIQKLQGCSAFARHYQRNNYCYLFLRVLRCFSSPGYLPQKWMLCLQHSGFPHSDIYGSKVICTSPQLFAAYHVLHRL